MHPNAIKLNSSFIPPWTHKLTLEDEGQAILQETIKAKRYVQDGVLKSYYIQAEEPTTRDLVKAMRVSALLAKHLRLAGNPVIYSPIAEVMCEQHILHMEREVESTCPVLTQIGKGYIVIPDFYSNTKVSPGEQWSYRETQEVGERLMRHVYAGGGLILAGKDPETGALEDFGKSLLDTVLTRFTIHKVGGRHV